MDKIPHGTSEVVNAFCKSKQYYFHPLHPSWHRFALFSIPLRSVCTSAVRTLATDMTVVFITLVSFTDKVKPGTVKHGTALWFS